MQYEESYIIWHAQYNIMLGPVGKYKKDIKTLLKRLENFNGYICFQDVDFYSNVYIFSAEVQYIAVQGSH